PPTSLPPDVSITVNSTQRDPLCSPSALMISITLCALNGAHGVDLNPFSFSVSQSSITYEYNGCRFDDTCPAGLTLSAPACFSCTLDFVFNDNGSPRTLTYHARSDLKPASVPF